MILDQDEALDAIYHPSLLPRQVFLPTVRERKNKLEADFFSWDVAVRSMRSGHLHLSRQSTRKKKKELCRENPLWVTRLVCISVCLWQHYSKLKRQQSERLGGRHDQKQHRVFSALTGLKNSWFRRREQSKSFVVYIGISEPLPFSKTAPKA